MKDFGGTYVNKKLLRDMWEKVKTHLPQAANDPNDNGGKHPAAPSHSLGYLRREEISSAPSFRSRPALAVWEKRKKERKEQKTPKKNKVHFKKRGTKRVLLVPRTRALVHLAKEDSLRRTYYRRRGGRGGKG